MAYSKLIFISLCVLFSLAYFTIETPKSSSVRNLSVPSTTSLLDGRRILITVPSYGMKQFRYLQEMIDSFRDLCEAGALVSLVVFATEPYTMETYQLLDSRAQCRHPTGSFDITFDVKSELWKLQFVDFHKLEFYSRLNEFDLFIYAEDDINIRPRHVAAYLEETEKIKDIVGEERFPDYSIGFIRYEMFHGERISWEQKGYEPVHDPGLEGNYISPINSHQAMYMATQEQLIAWKKRCYFHRALPPGCKVVNSHREFISSKQLFKEFPYNCVGCNVKKLLPIDGFEDLRVHHMPDKFLGIITQDDFPDKDRFDSSWIQNSLDLQQVRTEINPTNKGKWKVNVRFSEKGDLRNNEYLAVENAFMDDYFKYDNRGRMSVQI